MISTGRIILLLSLMLSSLPANAAWTLDGDNSSFYYVTNKAAAIAEVNSFGELSGEITDNGVATVDISLASVDTAIEIRNERMRDIVFEIAQYPVASVSMEVDVAHLEAMAVGRSMQQSYAGILSVKGAETPVDMELSVTRLAEGGLLIHNTRPIVLSAQSVGLADKVEELRGIAGLPSINPNIVVNVSLQFNSAM